MSATKAAKEIQLLHETTHLAVSIPDSGPATVKATKINSYSYGQGYLHGHDRCMQLTLMQAILRGKLSQWFEASEQAREVDRYMLKMGFYYQSRKEESSLKDSGRRFLKSYTEGLNQGRRHSWPLSLKLLKVPMETWTMADSLALLKLMGYMGLASGQEEAEKFIAQSLSNNVSPDYLASLFQIDFTQSDFDMIEVLKKVKFHQQIIPDHHFFKSLPTLKNSNHWALGPKRSKSGSALTAFDPHLEINRAPAIWYEMKAKIKDQSLLGITMPGVPGFVMGRNDQLSFSFTYGFMDTVDYFIEDISNEQVREIQQYSGLIKRTEKITDKKGHTEEVSVFETQRGILEVPESSVSKTGKLEDGLYLTRAWTGYNQGSAEAIEALEEMLSCRDIDSACASAKKLFISCNWIFIDREGQMAQQQSGYLPLRANAKSGLIPKLGYKEEGQWRKIHCPEKLYHAKNPDNQILATANQAIPAVDEHDNVNLPMGSYRYDRIMEVLESKEKWELEELKTLQLDITSLQAKSYLEPIKEMIPDTPSGRILKGWDYRYEENSQGAFLFEQYLKELYHTLFAPAFGEMAWVTLVSETSLMADFYGNFDRILLSPTDKDALWYASVEGQTLEEKKINLYRTILGKTLSKWPKAKLKRWGDVNRFNFTHILFGEKLGKIKLFNRGPYYLRGAKATVCQGNLYRSNGRVTTFAPSYRFIGDMNQDFAFTALPGERSDKLLTKFARSETKRYLQQQYKTVKMDIDS